MGRDTKVGSQSVTGGSLDATEQGASSGQRKVGDQSLIEKEHGGGKKRKLSEGPDDGDGGGGSGSGGGGGDAKRATGTGGLEGFPYAINTERVGQLTDTTAVVKNALQPSGPANPKRKGPGYLGSIITIARGKDKTPAAVAKQYQEEAFDDAADARDRFAMVVGVNQMASVTAPDSGLATLRMAAEGGVAGFQGFPLAAFVRLWEPFWINTETKQAASFETVRNAARNHTEEAKAAERVTPRAPAPVGPMRTATAAHSETAQYMAAMNQRFDDVYLHVGDADAVNLKAKPTDGPNEQPQGLFNRYDQVIGDHQASKGQSPLLATGGYRFRVDDDYTQYHGGATHPDPNANGAGKVSPQTAESAKLDMGVRASLAGVNPNVPYMPEPNLLIHSSVAEHADFGPTQKDESLALVRSIAKAKGQPGGKPSSQWAKDNMVFDTRAALYTDGGRFDEKTTGGDKTVGYGAGATDVPALFNMSLNAQSIAPNRPLGNSILRNSMTSGAMDVRVHDLRTALTTRAVGDVAEGEAPEPDAMEVEGPVQDAPASSVAELAALLSNITTVLNQALDQTLAPKPKKDEASSSAPVERYAEGANTSESRDKTAKKKLKDRLDSNAREQEDDDVKIPAKEAKDVERIEAALSSAGIAFPNALAQTQRAFAERLNLARRAGAGLIQREAQDLAKAAASSNTSKAKAKAKAKAKPKPTEGDQALATEKVKEMIALLAAAQVAINQFLQTFVARDVDQGVIDRENERRRETARMESEGHNALQPGAVTAQIGQLRISSPSGNGDIEMS